MSRQVEETFGDNVDYGQVVKYYSRPSSGGPTQYSHSVKEVPLLACLRLLGGFRARVGSTVSAGSPDSGGPA